MEMCLTGESKTHLQHVTFVIFVKFCIINQCWCDQIFGAKIYQETKK